MVALLWLCSKVEPLYEQGSLFLTEKQLHVDLSLEMLHRCRIGQGRLSAEQEDKKQVEFRRLS